MSEFIEFPKIPRLRRRIVITEKIDGTNAQVFVSDDGVVKAGSRSRWLEPTKQGDNHGFARWVEEHREELLQLGPGRHYGEWWGQGIQRGYGLKEKRFSLFNVTRWRVERPECCHVVPVLYEGEWDATMVERQIERLKAHGSWAAPGFDRPEGIVLFHDPSNALFKVTLERDEEPKLKHRQQAQPGSEAPRG